MDQMDVGLFTSLICVRAYVVGQAGPNNVDATQCNIAILIQCTSSIQMFAHICVWIRLILDFTFWFPSTFGLNVTLCTVETYYDVSFLSESCSIPQLATTAFNPCYRATIRPELLGTVVASSWGCSSSTSHATRSHCGVVTRLLHATDHCFSSPES